MSQPGSPLIVPLPLRVAIDTDSLRREAHVSRVVCGVALGLAGVAAVTWWALDIVIAAVLVGVALCVAVPYGLVAVVSARRARRHDGWLWTVHHDAIEFPDAGRILWSDVSEVTLRAVGRDRAPLTAPALVESLRRRMDDAGSPPVRVTVEVAVRDADAINGRRADTGLKPLSSHPPQIAMDVTHSAPRADVAVGVLTDAAQRAGVHVTQTDRAW